jgi:hypothetical protein
VAGCCRGLECSFQIDFIGGIKMANVDIFNREQLFFLMDELAKALSKISKRGEMFKLYLVGGAAMLMQYNSRPMTGDFDGDWTGEDRFKRCVNKVAKKHGLSQTWCNRKVTTGSGFTERIYTNSHIFLQFDNLTVYVADDDILLCMKLVAGRQKDGIDARVLVSQLRMKGVTVSTKWVYERLQYCYPDGRWEEMLKTSIGAKKFIEGLGD